MIVPAGIVVARGHDREHAQLPSESAVEADSDRGAATQGLLSELETALTSGDVDAAVQLAGLEGAQEVRQLAKNVRRLDLADLRLRFLSEGEVGSARVAAGQQGRETWVASVAMTWRLAGVHQGTATADVPIRLEQADDGTARFIAVETGAAKRLPLWLQAPVQVRRGDRALVVTARRDVERLLRQAEEAVLTVNRTLPRWDGNLVVEAPRTPLQFEKASGMAPAQAQAIAAVTARADATDQPRSPVQVYLNPAVFDPLGPRAQQIVLSHEATHVVVDALSLSMPKWLSEGFADFVALAGTDLPKTTLAAQILAFVRKEGAPNDLPGRAEFDGSADHLGAWYEGAWLAADLIAQRHGEPALIELFDQVAATGDTTRAFREVLGTTEREFVQEWRAYLVELAR